MTLLKIHDLFNIVVRDRNLDILKEADSNVLTVLYSVLSEVVDSLFVLEFSREVDSKAEFVKSLLRSFTSSSSGVMTENLFIQEFLNVAVPVLYVCEEDLKMTEVADVENSDFVEIFVLLLTLMMRGIPEDRRIHLRTVELKQYSKTRVDLDEEDWIDLSKGTAEFVGVRACVYKVNRLKVLCGFFNEDGNWRSEKYAQKDDLQKVLKKYNLVCKK